MNRYLITLSLPCVLAACGGSSSGTGAILSLRAPEQVSLVDAKDAPTAALRLPDTLRGLVGSDYETDRTRFWVRDESMRALETINSILSSLQQTNYWLETNAGPYRALVAEIDGGGRNDAVEYSEWIIDSRRASNRAPQIVSFWLPQRESMGSEEPSLIYGRLTITAEPTDDQPLGQFTLFFKNLPLDADANSTDSLFQGYLRTVPRNDGQSELEFYLWANDVDGSLEPGQMAARERAHVIGDPAADSGRAYTEQVFVRNEGGTVQEERSEFELQFDSDYVARRNVQDGNALAVLDRNDYRTLVYRYGLYDGSNERRVERMSGFPVRNAQGRYGWAGYHGVWFPPEVTLTDGETLYRQNFSSNDSTPYVLVIVNGRLQKRTRSSITLGDLVNEDLEYFHMSTGSRWRVVYTGSDLLRTAEQNGNEWAPIEPPESIVEHFQTGQWCNFWSPARGSIEFAWPATLATSTPAHVWAQTPIDADSPELAGGTLTLHGYFNLLRPQITQEQANFIEGASPYFPNATGVNTGNRVYTFSAASLLLTLGGSPVTLAPGVTVTQGPGLNGFHCGPLFPSALSSFEEIPQQTITYEWSTGPNPWNQFRGLRTLAGASVRFDPPLRLGYVHQETGSPFDGRTFFLEWDGSNLHGIPHQQDPATGYWRPRFNIPTGTVLTLGEATYLVKQLEGEQYMVEVDDPASVYEQRGFDLDAVTISRPTSTPYRDPAIGPRPTVDTPPRYVGGVAQNGDG